MEGWAQKVEATRFWAASGMIALVRFCGSEIVRYQMNVVMIPPITAMEPTAMAAFQTTLCSSSENEFGSCATRCSTGGMSRMTPADAPHLGHDSIPDAKIMVHFGHLRIGNLLSYDDHNNLHVAPRGRGLAKLRIKLVESSTVMDVPEGYIHQQS